MLDNAKETLNRCDYPLLSMRGRKPASLVRSNMIELLYVLKQSHGYDLALHYNAIFPKVSQRLIYYHLKKGVDLGIFEVAAVKKEKGTYSWGATAEKIYYTLSNNAAPVGNRKVQQYVAQVKQ